MRPHSAAAGNRCGNTPLPSNPAGRELRALLERVSAHILSYRIAPDGSLDQPQVVVRGIVVTNRHHSAHGLANDGRYIYASIGHPEERVRPNGGFFHRQAPPFPAASGRRADLMGTIVRFRPGDTEVAVWAAGLRNTYGISITPDGTIYGADNDQQDGIQLLPAGGVERHY